MNRSARFIRSIAKTRFRFLKRATIKEISGQRFELLFKQLVADGWRLRSKYEGFDAGVDYDCIRLRRGFATLKCEWDNWSEWSIEGKREVVEEIARRTGLPVAIAWRWSDHDDAKSDA